MLSQDSYQNDKDLISEKRTQQFQKNAYHNDKCLISEPASSSLWPAVRKNTLSKISYQKRPKNVAKGERFDK